MNNELIKRINTRNQAWVSDGMKDKIMTDCKAEIERLTKALEAKPVGEPVAVVFEEFACQVHYIETIDPKKRLPIGTKLYTAPPSIDALIAEIDGLQKVDLNDFGVPYPSTDGDFLYSEDIRVTLDKYRGAK